MGMLALERNVNQEIVIDTTGIVPGEIIKIMVLRIGNKDGHGASAKLGVDCPRQCAVHRREVYDAIQREQRLAAVRKT